MNFQFISKNQRWHLWYGNDKWLLSDEQEKVITYHDSINDAINYLWLMGYRPEALELNTANKKFIN